MHRQSLLSGRAWFAGKPFGLAVGSQAEHTLAKSCSMKHRLKLIVGRSGA